MDRRAELVDVIRSVRNRWRLRLALRGAVIVVAGTLLALLPVGLEPRGASLQPDRHHRVPHHRACRLRRAGLAFLARPLRRRVTDGQVALYLEENDPTLEAAILSAIEATSDSTHLEGSLAAPGRASSSSRRSRSAARSRTAIAVDRQAVKRHVLTLGGVAVAALALVVLGPAFLRHGLSALLDRDAQRRSRRARTASTSRPGTPRCRAAPISRSTRSSSASRRKTRR